MGRLDGKVALITGGARGQGRAMALRFAEEGADIAFLDAACKKFETVPYEISTEEDLERTRRDVEELGAGCIAEIGDVRNQGDLDRLVASAVERWGHLDIACASAGVHSFAPIWEMPDEVWSELIDINLTGVWRTGKAVARQMMDQRSGTIIATSSVMGRETGPDLSHYTAAKHGVLGLVKSFAYELGPHGIRANALLPSVVHDLMGDNPPTRKWVFGHEDATTEDYVEATRHWHLLRGHAALPAVAVANAALWLASDEARHITGVEIPVDCGHCILPGYNTEPVIDDAVEVGPYENDGVVLPVREEA
jgi:SDR family mycofactocin-dependent oxidoreductase